MEYNECQAMPRLLGFVRSKALTRSSQPRCATAPGVGIAAVCSEARTLARKPRVFGIEALDLPDPLAVSRCQSRDENGQQQQRRQPGASRPFRHCQVRRTDWRYSSGRLESNSWPRMSSLPKPTGGGVAPRSRMIFSASVASMTCWASFL